MVCPTSRRCACRCWLSCVDSHDTGNAYLLYASDNNQNFKITRLDADYYNVTTTVSQLSGSYKAIECD